MAPILSTRTVIGSNTSMPIERNNWYTNLISLAHSDIATNSASVDDNVTDFCSLLLQGTLIKYSMNPDILIRVSHGKILQQ